MAHIINEHIQEILNEIKERVNRALSKHAKVMLVRYDLTFPEDIIYSNHSTYLSSFLNKLRHNLTRRRYDPIDFWVREQNTSLNPHYHCFLLLDGHKVQNPYAIFPTLTSLWASTIGDERKGLVDFCNQQVPGYENLNGCRLTRADEQLYEDCINWLSYLAKGYTKGNAPPHTREYGGSRLTRLQTDNLQPFSF